MRKTHITAFIFASCLSAFAHAASFDCAKAATTIEKLICADAKVSALDEQLTAAYKAASETATDKDALKTQQRDWLKQKRNACGDVECLGLVYQARIDEIKTPVASVVANTSSSEVKLSEAAPVDQAKKSPTFKFVTGDSYPICKPYLDMLNAAKYTETPACERKILPQFSQFKAIEWTEITDKKEMVTIIQERLKILYILKKMKLDSVYEKEQSRIIQSIQDGKLSMYFFKMDIDKDGIEDTIYKTTWFYDEAKKYDYCEKDNIFYMNLSSITLETASKYADDPYRAFNFSGSNDLFIFNNGIYASHWTGKFIDMRSNLKIYGLWSESICGFLVN